MEDTSLLVSVVFEFEHQGNPEVFLTGTFFDWDNPVKLQKSDKTKDIYHVTLSLPTGIYYYKYIINGEWKINPKHPQTIDYQGNINNCILVELSQPGIIKTIVFYIYKSTYMLIF